MIGPGTYEIENPPKVRIAKRYRTIVISDDGRLFIHPAIAGNESTVLMCAIADSVGFMITKKGKGVSLIPAEWAEKEFPKSMVKEFIAMVERLESD